jgi:hypothetical protein
MSAIAPTVKASAAAPGLPIVQVPAPSLPAATATVRPAACAAFTASESASAPPAQPAAPSDRLIASIPYVARFWTTHSMPLMMSSVQPLPAESRTFTPTSAAPGATPAYRRSGRPSPSPAIVAATWVP